MYDLSDFRPTNKEMAIAILVGVIVLLVAFCAGYCLGEQRTKDLYNNGAGVADVSNELGQAGTNISNATAGISEAQGHAGNIEAGINSAQESAGYIQSTATESAGIIAECKSIIERIRSRGTAQKSNN